MTPSTPRPEVLSGPTYRAKVDLPEPVKFYLTINEHDGKPFEIFMRTDVPHLHEWVNAITLLVTRMLRAGIPLGDIAAELQQVHSGGITLHMAGNEQCPSIVARVGRKMSEHLQQRRAP